MTTWGGPPQAGRSISWKGRTSAAVLTCVALGLGSAVPADAATPPPPKPAPKPAPKPVVLKGDAVGATDWGDVSASLAAGAVDESGVWAANRDLGSMYSLTARAGIQAAWTKGVIDKEVTGKDVTVAVIDTGIAPVAGLDGNEKVVNGPDLSFEGQAATTRYIDGYGHGSHMAGIIAGKDEQFDTKHPDATRFAGVAPDAKLLNMKVGTADGGADVSQVIAALDWVVEHRRDHGMNVRVVNLAYGTESVQRWQVDPLARAVENAWKAGLVVVTAAGNDGLGAPSLLMPAVDPHVLAVGAVDNAGTPRTGDDAVADFTNGGNAARRPDVLAPGKSVVSLRVPGSYVDEQHPEGLVNGDTSERFFRGSGTSQATAVVSGEVALLLSARPSLTPDQVKAILMATADPLTANPSPVMGAGVTDLPAALTAAVPATATAAALPDSTGTGSLEASRGGEHVVDPETGDVLTGELDALGMPWRGSAWAEASTKGTSWTDGSWNGEPWTGKGWDKNAWRAAAWPGSAWSGVAWSKHRAPDAQWEARGWRGEGWEARGWRGDGWEARSWREESWTARGWRSLP
jgi:serine protease AprX